MVAILMLQKKRIENFATDLFSINSLNETKNKIISNCLQSYKEQLSVKNHSHKVNM